MMAAILNSNILNSVILLKKNFTHSFWLILMMATILNFAMLDSDTAILDSDTLLSSLRFTQKHTSSTLTLTQTHSFSPNLMMATILNSAILDSAILHKTLTQTNSNSLKLIHSYLTLWWQSSWILPSWILPSWIQPFCFKLWLQLIQSDPVIYSHSTWWWQPSWILSSWIQPFCTKKNFTHSFWLNLMMAIILNSSILNSAILDSAILLQTLTPTNSIWPSHLFSLNLMMAGHLEFCHIGFSHFAEKKTTLIPSDSTWWWQPSWILPTWIPPSWIQPS